MAIPPCDIFVEPKRSNPTLMALSGLVQHQWEDGGSAKCARRGCPGKGMTRPWLMQKWIHDVTDITHDNELCTVSYALYFVFSCCPSIPVDADRRRVFPGDVLTQDVESDRSQLRLFCSSGNEVLGWNSTITPNHKSTNVVSCLVMFGCLSSLEGVNGLKNPYPIASYYTQACDHHATSRLNTLW